MKALIILTVSLFSLNAFSAQVSEDKKGTCLSSIQGSRENAPKIVNDTAPQAPVVPGTKTLSL